MADIGSILFDFFTPLGPWGGLIFIFLLFYIDAILFPTLPELFVVLVFVTQDNQTTAYLFGYAIAMLAVIVVAEVLGVLTLYFIVKKAKRGRFGEKIHRAIEKYRNFLVVRDERMILVNRIAPILPYLGAFLALSIWDLKKSLTYMVIGGIVKYGVVLALSGFFLAYFEQGTAQIATLILVFGMIIASFIASYFRKRKMENANRAA